MTLTQIAFTGVAVALWLAAYLLFFHGDVKRWRRWRAADRAERKKQDLELRERQAQMIEELATCYTVPSKRPNAHA
jgi:hypothetical protein